MTYGLSVVGRREFVRELAASLSKGGRSVAYPDHPVLMRGPDVLAHVGEGLVAYFVFTGNGPTPRSGAEQARILLSRFALPIQTRFILVVPSGGTELREPDSALMDGIQIGVGRGLGPRQDAELGNSSAASVINELRPFHLRRYSDAWATRPQVQVPSFASPRPGVPTSELGRPRKRRSQPPWAAIDNGVLYAGFENLPGRLGLGSAVTRLVTTAVDMDYATAHRSLWETAAALEGGDAHLSLHHANFPSVKLNRSADPFKPLRAAAFAGVRRDNMERP